VRRITAADDPGVVGDESILLARRTGAPVAIGRDRPAAAQLLAGDGCDVIVSDDGLQHYALARDCEVVVIDGDRRFGNGWLLPAGPLREAPGRLRAADAVVVNGGRALLPGALSMRSRRRLRWPCVAGRCSRSARLRARRSMPSPYRQPRTVLQHAAVARDRSPGRPLPDHAHLEPQDIEFGDDKSVFMTEKDAVKCGKFAGARHWFVPVSACFDGGERIHCWTSSSERLKNAIKRRKDRPMDKRLLELLVCPICKGPLRASGSGATMELICRPDRLAYGVRDGIR